MRVALCQINTTVGDLEGNRARSLAAAQKAAEAGAELALFPEHTLPGYLPRDLLDRPAFVADNARALERSRASCRAGSRCIVGFVDHRSGAARAVQRGRADPRRRDRADLPQAAAAHLRRVRRGPLLRAGRLPGRSRSRARASASRSARTPGTPSTRRCAASTTRIRSSELRRRAARGADQHLRRRRSRWASARGRPAMLAAIARAHRRPLVFVNQVGGNDELIFDGSSAVYGPDGSVVGERAELRGERRDLRARARAAAGAAARGAMPRPRSTRSCSARATTRASAASRARCSGSRAASTARSSRRSRRARSAPRTCSAWRCRRATRRRAASTTRARWPRRSASASARSPIDAIFQRYLDVLTPELAALGAAPAADDAPSRTSRRASAATC